MVTRLGAYKCQLDGATQAGCCCFVLVRPAVLSNASQGEEGLGLVVGHDQYCCELVSRDVPIAGKLMKRDGHSLLMNSRPGQLTDLYTLMLKLTI